MQQDSLRALGKACLRASGGHSWRSRARAFMSTPPQCSGARTLLEPPRVLHGSWP